MSTFLPTLRQLEYLVAVIDLRHFGHAAERCHATQSTLSAGIRELETLLQVQLVERTRRSVTPTPLGIELAEKARDVLNGARDIAETATAAGQPLSGRMRLGVIPTIGPFVIPRVLKGLCAAYPDLQLRIDETLSETALDKLHRGELEVAIIALPYDTGDFKTMTLGRDRFLLAMARNHPLARQPSVHPKDIPQDELMVLEDGHCLRDQALQACQFTDLPTNNIITAPNLYVLAEMAANGLCVTFLPEIAATSGMINANLLSLRRIESDAANRTIVMVWRPSFRRDLDIAALGAYLKGRMSGLRLQPK